MKRIKMIFQGSWELGVSASLTLSEQRAVPAAIAKAWNYSTRSRVDMTRAVASPALTRSATRQCLLLDCCMLHVPSFDPRNTTMLYLYAFCVDCLDSIIITFTAWPHKSN